MSYDDPNATLQRERYAGEAGGGATTDYGKFRMYQKGLIKNVHAVVTTAGTVAGHGFDVYVGTSSVGTLAIGTAAAGSIVSAGDIEAAYASLDELKVTSLADATGKADIVFEINVDHDATHTD